MSTQGKDHWNKLYDMLEGHELTAETYLMQVEVLNVIRKAMPDQSELDVAVALLVIADSNLRKVVDEIG